MRTRSYPAVRIALLASMLGGCYRFVAAPAIPPPIRLVAVTGFLIEQPASGRMPAGSCVALRAEGAVAQVSGDTLHLVRVTVLQQPPLATQCPHSGPSFIVVSAHPDLRAEAVRQSGTRLGLAVMLAVPALLAALLVMLDGPLM